MIYFQSLTQEQLAGLLLPLSRVKVPSDSLLDPKGEQLELKKAKQARYRAKQIFHWVYQRSVTDWDQMTDLAKDVRVWLKEHVGFYSFSQCQDRRAADGTQKVLWTLDDGHTVEGVIIPADEEASRVTACISSQVGCAMGCRFCLTGTQGFERNLEVHEIITQVFELNKRVPLTNIVFMGMGEPFRNLDAVVTACQILLDQDGMSFSKRRITVSTSGWVPGIEEFGKRMDVSLAISLNATTDEQRSKIMPVNRKWNLEALLGACRKYPLGSHRRITFEYVLLKDVNDSLEDAARLIQLVRGIPSKINLIAFNEHPGSDYHRPTEATVRAFQRYLLDRNLTATIRASRGQEILAACGQLRSAAAAQKSNEC